MTITYHEFSLSVKRTAKALTPRDAKLNAVIGLVGEAGEVADLVKKEIFHEHPHNREKMLSEVGDVMFYLQWLAHEFNFTLQDAMLNNKQKLELRYPNGFSPEASKNRVL